MSRRRTRRPLERAARAAAAPVLVPQARAAVIWAGRQRFAWLQTRALIPSSSLMPLFPPPQDDSLWQKMCKLVGEGDVAGMKAWVKAGGDVNQEFFDSFGTPHRLLTLAATDGDADMVRVLLAQGADIDGLEEGRTALATAVTASAWPTTRLPKFSSI